MSTPTPYEKLLTKLILNDHERVHLFQDILGVLLEKSDSSWVRDQLRVVSRSLSRHLETHFWHEEAFGDLSNISESNPELHREILDIFAEHKRFSNGMEKIRGAIVEASFEELKEGYDQLFNSLKEHESREKNCLGKAIYRDIGGAGD